LEPLLVLAGRDALAHRDQRRPPDLIPSVEFRLHACPSPARRPRAQSTNLLLPTAFTGVLRASRKRGARRAAPERGAQLIRRPKQNLRGLLIRSARSKTCPLRTRP